MKKPAAGTAGKVEIHAINLGPSAGGNQSLVSHEVLDLESCPILNNEKIHPESEPRQSHFSRPHRSRRGRVRRQSGRVPAVQAGPRHGHTTQASSRRTPARFAAGPRTVIAGGAMVFGIASLVTATTHPATSASVMSSTSMVSRPHWLPPMAGTQATVMSSVRTPRPAELGSGRSPSQPRVTVTI